MDSIRATYDAVWHRADTILQNSDSILVLGKDTGPSMNRLKRIAAKLEQLGYYPFIIKDQPDRLGEGVIQKVMRFALSSKFVIVENTEPSGHLYEVPHVAKAAECITVFLQEKGKGSTWMFEDGYPKHAHWHKESYREPELEAAVEAGTAWAEEFHKGFAMSQTSVLPWLQQTTTK